MCGAAAATVVPRQPTRIGEGLQQLFSQRIINPPLSTEAAKCRWSRWGAPAVTGGRPGVRDRAGHKWDGQLSVPGTVRRSAPSRSVRRSAPHTGSIRVCKVPLALYGATFQLLEGTLVSYTPPKLFTCCQRHMHAPQPRPRRLPWSSPPSAPALVSRPSTAPWAAPRPGPRALFAYVNRHVV